LVNISPSLEINSVEAQLQKQIKLCDFITYPNSKLSGLRIIVNPPYKESNKTTIDFDEQNTYQGLSRNDPYRPINGLMNRKQMIDPYIREELEKEERKVWWGNGEV
jgi:hypothetical protein